MSDRLRTLLLAVAFSMIAAGALRSLSPASLTPVNGALLFVLCCMAAVLVNRRLGRRDGEDDFADADPGQPRKGPAYEDRCKAILEAAGWQVVRTPRTRDRGADIFAIKGRTKVAIQCKAYKTAVRYKAVAEILAARTFYPADHLCVVAPNGFTNDAKDSAREGKVALLHHDELRGWLRRLS